MPITHYKCPNGRIIKCEDCIKECPSKFRCVSPGVVSYIYNSQRKWKGKLSVTTISQPATKTVLAIKKDLTIEPVRHIYPLLGTLAHIKHEEGNKLMESVEPEVRLEVDKVYGTADILEEKNGKYYLRDVKNKKTSQAHFILDYDEENRFALPSWKQKGTKIKEDDDVTIQLNIYRKMIEETRDIKISGLYMDSVFIDWSPAVSPNRYGLKYQSYVVPVPFVSDDELEERIDRKVKEVNELLEDESKMKPCYETSDWKEFGTPGSRCKLYCDSASACKKHFGDNHKYL